jgi:hypothetical protein
MLDVQFFCVFDKKEWIEVKKKTGLW